MSRSLSFRGSLAAVLLAGVAPAAAQAGADAPPAVSPAGDQFVLGIEIHIAAAELDTRAVREAITSDLGVRLTENPAEATAKRPALGVIVVTLDGAAARVVYRRDGAAAIERTLTLPAAPGERVQLIAFLVTNLVRDQASEALEALSRSPALTATVVVTAPAPDAHPVHEQLATIGLVPPLQVDRVFAPRSVVGFGIYGIMGMQDGTRYASLSGAVDYQRQFASGLQAAGAVAYSPRVDGAQLGGAVSVAGELEGLQMAGAATVATRVHGAQIAGAAAVAREVHGLQLAGAANVAGEVRGVQVAPVNYAQGMHGLQLGVVNISDGNDDAVPIGLINIARHGRTEFEAAVDSSEMSTLTLRHGPKYVQNVWGVGWVPGNSDPLLGIGLGAHVGFPAFSVDVDAMMWNPVTWDADGTTLLNQLRATVAVPVGPVDIVGGAIGNVYVEDGNSIREDLHPHLDKTYVTGTTKVTLWPSAFLGLRLRT